MPSYKLTYFDSRGRAEATRLLLSLAGQPFEDVRVTKEQWKDMKPSTKFGLLPQLEIDGKVLTQSRAMLMYLGREFGFYPTNQDDAFKVDEIIFIMEDYFYQAVKLFLAKPEDKEAVAREYTHVHIPRFNGYLEKILKENDEGSSYFVGDKITIADIAVYDFVSNRPDFLADFPLLKGLVERVGSLDKIKEWVEKRPKSQF